MNKDKYLNRSSIRKYTKKEISNELLYSLIDCATHAPTTGGMQLYSIVVTRDDENKKRLAPAHFNQSMITEAPIVLTFCADYNRFCKWCDNRDAKHGYNNFQSFMTSVLDTTIVAQQFNTIAEEAGLGCCYIGTTTYNAPQIASILNLPPMVIPIITITLGFPAEDPAKIDRLPLSGIIHNETYTDYSDKDINEIYSEKESLEVNKQFVSENNKQTLAQVFTDIRYNKANNEHFSKVFADFIDIQGYEFPK